MENEKTAREQIVEALKSYWYKTSRPSVIAAKHSEFVVEPTIFIGNELNPEILKLLVMNYLVQTSTMDSGVGNVEVSPEKLVIKNKKGKPLIVVKDQNIIQQYLASRA